MIGDIAADVIEKFVKRYSPEHDIVILVIAPDGGTHLAASMPLERVPDILKRTAANTAISAILNYISKAVK